MPDDLVRNPDMDIPDAPLATVIACGHVLRDSGSSGPASVHLPCFQALGPWGAPDAGLPWFRIGQPGSERGSGDRLHWPAAAPEPLADILRHTRWLHLVVGSDHDSLSLALALATYARSRGIRVTALLAGQTGQPFFQRAALEHRTDHVHDCPAGLDPLLALQALWPLADGYRPDDQACVRPDPGTPAWPGQK